MVTFSKTKKERNNHEGQFQKGAWSGLHRGYAPTFHSESTELLDFS